MKQISLTTRRTASRQSAATLAEKALEFLTSRSLCVILGVAALVAVLWHDATGAHAAWLAVTVTLWAAQLCAMAAVDIEKGGES